MRLEVANTKLRMPNRLNQVT